MRRHRRTTRAKRRREQPEQMDEEGERSGFQAEGQARSRGGTECDGFAERSVREAGSGAGAKAVALRPPGV